MSPPVFRHVPFETVAAQWAHAREAEIRADKRIRVFIACVKIIEPKSVVFFVHDEITFDFSKASPANAELLQLMQAHLLESLYKPWIR